MLFFLDVHFISTDTQIMLFFSPSSERIHLNADLLLFQMRMGWLSGLQLCIIWKTLSKRYRTAYNESANKTLLMSMDSMLFVWKFQLTYRIKQWQEEKKTHTDTNIEKVRKYQTIREFSFINCNTLSKKKKIVFLDPGIWSCGENSKWVDLIILKHTSIS